MHANLNLPPLLPALLPTARRLGLALLRIASRLPTRHQPLGADELRGMGDLELRDLGLGRSEIPHVLRPPRR